MRRTSSYASRSTRTSSSWRAQGRSSVLMARRSSPTAVRPDLDWITVNNRREVRDFLVSRRAKITPDRAGLAAYGSNRRGPGLRRGGGAMLAGGSGGYYPPVGKGDLPRV